MCATSVRAGEAMAALTSTADRPIQRSPGADSIFALVSKLIQQCCDEGDGVIPVVSVRIGNSRLVKPGLVSLGVRADQTCHTVTVVVACCGDVAVAIAREHVGAILGWRKDCALLEECLAMITPPGDVDHGLSAVGDWEFGTADLTVEVRFDEAEGDRPRQVGAHAQTEVTTAICNILFKAPDESRRQRFGGSVDVIPATGLEVEVHVCKGIGLQRQTFIATDEDHLDVGERLSAVVRPSRGTRRTRPHRGTRPRAGNPDLKCLRRHSPRRRPQ